MAWGLFVGLALRQSAVCSNSPGGRQLSWTALLSVLQGQLLLCTPDFARFESMVYLFLCLWLFIDDIALLLFAQDRPLAGS